MISPREQLQIDPNFLPERESVTASSLVINQLLDKVGTWIVAKKIKQMAVPFSTKMQLKNTNEAVCVSFTKQDNFAVVKCDDEYNTEA